ncbi:ABC transporter [Alkalihalobacillus alcalophilus ATCC 27647 = CGMCC 1.3604]|uniref:ABC transporter n=2 Tax=Alkalihalobacillus alcalophilus ATCC 27647 = CGMCC 1.3604 TaxID=1218173 RepID=A0A094YVN4_ALKAL|nr:ABC transporter permease [Alkalihalobacillus alcalophilus]KGA97577.1 ABC transporter ATP-binding protein [Alkalihalobacillus alcalophilus ATCC 27647 = CGMCC 1.3604]MED1562959.1 ABC transporter permease [Alkalihalobacillus alcalophilus]THG91146.1 ABC transporter [Alkalihalobacillus alcalophilus ATCC 27647 = CGMCC 1.3604]
MARGIIDTGQVAVTEKKRVSLSDSWKIKQKEVIKKVLPPVLALGLFIVLWEVSVRVLGIAHYILPKPTDIYVATVANWDNLIRALQTTVIESVLGFMFSVIIGIGVAVLMASSKWIERSFYPYAIILQTIPVVAIAPIIVIWFGSGMNAIIIIAFTIGFFPMLSNTLIGLNATDHKLKDLFQLYNASKWQIMWKLRFPAALPFIIAGMKISCTLAVVGAIVGEYIAGVGGGAGGIGYAITVAASRLQTPYLFALGLSAAVLGIVFFLLVSFFSRKLLSSWHESELEKE